jgi:Rieske Fe-S protein
LPSDPSTADAGKIPEGSPKAECAGGSNRRGALGWISALLATLGAAAAGVPVIGYLLGPLFRPISDAWVDLGALDEFPVDQTRLVDLLNPLRRPWDGDAGRLAVYVRRETGENLTVFAINCTHLGCPVSWFPQSGLFLCPCHGGVYYADGQRASGPPPRGLYRYESRIADGRLQIRTGHLPTLGQPG